MTAKSPARNVRPAPDKALVDIADYVVAGRIGEAALASARLCLTDTLACALDALDHPECTKLLGPLVPGTVVPHGARVPGTSHELDPATATFNFGAMIRWLDFNDTFTAAQGSHPSDNLAGVLMLADHLSRQRAATGRAPLVMRDVLKGLVQAYEIQGCIAIENNFQQAGIDHPILTRVASTAVLTRMLGGTRDEIVNAVSNAWIDVPLAVVRQAPNTGWRKSWAAADASFTATRLAYMAVKGEMGYPSVLSAKRYGFYEARFHGKHFRFQRRYGDYVIRHSMFKFVPAGMHSQSAVECALRLHPLVGNRLPEVKRVAIDSQRALMGIMNKSGPLYNPADRDHCAQYVVAIGLIFGRLHAADFEDHVAADPRIDALRDKTTIVENPRFSRDFYDPKKRSSANAVQVFFRDGSSTPRVEVQYPIGHPRRRAEAAPMLRTKLEASLARRFPRQRCERILALCDDARRLDRTPVNEFVDMLAM
ncbi:MAG TPA: bifunctional 2-methylcitrate dehydratase/aconitate hydratase [Burkholderiales bacterium]|nr:bifunctional 2-methylcitrate dehydratase/aconitate hydratase [Burkholderiales bacterium]